MASIAEAVQNDGGLPITPAQQQSNQMSSIAAAVHVANTDAIASKPQQPLSFLQTMDALAAAKAKANPGIISAIGAGLTHGAVTAARGVEQLATDVASIGGANAGRGYAGTQIPQTPEQAQALQGQIDQSSQQLRQEQQQSEDQFAMTGQQSGHPGLAWMASGIPSQVPPLLVGGAGYKIGDALLPKAENTIVQFLRNRLVDSIGGAAATSVMPLTPDQSRAQNMAVGAAISPVFGGVIPPLAKYAASAIAKGAGMINPNINRLLIGMKFLKATGNQVPEIADMAGMGLPGVTPSLGQATGNTGLMDIEAAIKDTQLGRAAMLEHLTNNVKGIQDNMQKLAGNLLDNVPEGIQETSRNIRNTIDGLEATDSSNESATWNKFKERWPGTGFSVQSIRSLLQTYAKQGIDPAFQQEMKPLVNDISKRLDDIAEARGKIADFNDVKDLRTVLLNKARDTEDTNYKRVVGGMARALTEYMTNDGGLVTKDGLPISPNVKQQLIGDFNNARDATKNYYSIWGDSGLNDLIERRGSGEFKKGLGAVQQMFNPAKPDTVDYTVSALSRQPGGLDDARKLFMYNLLKKAQSNSFTVDGLPTINLNNAADYLSSNMAIAKKIWPEPESQQVLEHMNDFFKTASRKSPAGLTRDMREKILGNVGTDTWLSRLLFRHYTGGNIYLRGSVGDALSAIPKENYDKMFVDAVNDPTFGAQLMKEAKGSTSAALLKRLGPYANRSAQVVASESAAKSLNKQPTLTEGGIVENLGEVTNAGGP